MSALLLAYMFWFWALTTCIGKAVKQAEPAPLMSGRNSGNATSDIGKSVCEEFSKKTMKQL